MDLVIEEKQSKEYEISFLVTQEAERSAVDAVLKAAGAQVSYQEPLREIRLAYPMGKHVSAFFGFYYFKSESSAIANINGALKLKPEVIRFLIITPPVPRKTRERVNGKPTAPQIVEPRPPAELSNEALSQKLEEILK
ncbi:MAG: 30S ribosomal protein S6 [Patescibacteria group bacterium]